MQIIAFSSTFCSRSWFICTSNALCFFFEACMFLSVNRRSSSFAWKGGLHAQQAIRKWRSWGVTLCLLTESSFRRFLSFAVSTISVSRTAFLKTLQTQHRNNKRSKPTTLTATRDSRTKTGQSTCSSWSCTEVRNVNYTIWSRSHYKIRESHERDGFACKTCWTADNLEWHSPPRSSFSRFLRATCATVNHRKHNKILAKRKCNRTYSIHAAEIAHNSLRTRYHIFQVTAKPVLTEKAIKYMHFSIEERYVTITKERMINRYLKFSMGAGGRKELSGSFGIPTTFTRRFCFSLNSCSSLSWSLGSSQTNANMSCRETLASTYFTNALSLTLIWSNEWPWHSMKQQEYLPHEAWVWTHHCHDGLVNCSAEVVFVLAQPQDGGVRVATVLAKLQQALVGHVCQLAHFGVQSWTTKRPISCGAVSTARCKIGIAYGRFGSWGRDTAARVADTRAQPESSLESLVAWSRSLYSFPSVIRIQNK